jgi:hypothetical protein
MSKSAALRIARDMGGNIWSPPPVGPTPEPVPDVPAGEHVGAITSHVSGRTDHLPMHVPSGSYVIPADIIGAMGEGNTLSGFKVADSLFKQPFYGNKKAGAAEPYATSIMPYGQSPIARATGGAVPIVAAGGEYVIHPKAVEAIGKGNLDDGHRILDEFVKQMRAKTVKTLQKLPGPKKD